ncbi:MAG: septation ring formation regulator EzrA [Floccifex porci]|uniref:Negative regulator of septation ring formation n=1 Tax=Floccifex porci TaxID=2606629 RepID=A0A7X2T4Z7_9FIRM|nr:septation ring formation regulator EzrA [Floccifex porci]MDD7467720.1 septation ring formation regulator EzrA [Floccifex porci]MSS02346.1 negative regulator of septation ring formation [Floccifex porci]
MDSFLKIVSDIGSAIVKYFNTALDFALDHLSMEMIIYICIAFLVLILVLILSRTLKRKKIERRLKDLEIVMNEIRNNTLTFKYNKATAFARSNSDILEKVRAIAPRYENCIESIQRCESLFTLADDKVDAHKLKKARLAMDDLDEIIDETKEKIRIITQSLDLILIPEKEVREQSNAVKEQFGNLKKVYQANRTSFYDAGLYFDALLQEIENGFSGFEEWMFASEFNKAKEELDKLSKSIEETSSRIAAYPGYYEKAKVILPSALNEVSGNIETTENSDVEIDFDRLKANVSKADEQIKEVVSYLDKGNDKEAKNILDTLSEFILSIQDDLDKETKAYNEIHGDLQANLGLLDEVIVELKEIESLYSNIKDRFGLEDWSKRFVIAEQQVISLKKKREQVQKILSDSDTLSSQAIHDYRIYADEVNTFSQQIKAMKQMLVGASSDESRAQKQLIKLQLILNEVRLNASTRFLPSISDQFNEDIEEGERLITRVSDVLSHSPLDVQTLNADLQEAIDFIYKLYNNANNLIGIAIMVENAIVFGNRFRSSYPEMDSELTRAELCFQNGEYTKALKVAIQAIESLHPGIYEKLVARKDPAVMNTVQ